MAKIQELNGLVRIIGNSATSNALNYFIFGCNIIAQMQSNNKNLL